MTETSNTGEIQENLRQEYNPGGSVLGKAQLRLLDMATYLQETAEKTGVPCRSDGRNVLGAMRHEGFIPWDDDADMVVDYGDFKRLCDYLKAHPCPRYVSQDNDMDPDFYKEWVYLRDLKSENRSHNNQQSADRRTHEAQKLRGLHVDTFPYEGNMILWLQRLAAKLSANVNTKLAGRYPLLTQIAYKSLHVIVSPVFRLVGRLFGNPDLYMHSYGAWFYEQNPHCCMTPHKDIVLEGHAFEGPADADELCRITYGNYMDSPSRDRRDRHKMDVVFKQ